MKTDIDLKKDAEAELRWTPNVDEKHIGVVANKSVVTLSGTVRTFLEKYQAECAIKRLAGVAGVANDIEVRLDGDDVRPDSEIAENIAHDMRLEVPMAYEHIKILAHGGHVTLEGTAEWYFQREHAEAIARRQKGVTAVTNLVVVRPRIEPRDIQRSIQAAFHRSAQQHVNQIVVEANGGIVTLKGAVPTWAEREQAQETAWRAPGVVQVKNELRIV